MSGKPYTIGEMKTIVDYLVENKLYGEIKARKMWMDFANTKITTRTWQSLKETFLKRILPDIHNPYFRLTNEQISSFRARCDLAERNKNKLEIQTISDDSSSNDNIQKAIEPANNEGETTAGENIKSSKIPTRSRSSAETIIVENCYETAEEIQKELEAQDTDVSDVKQAPPSKSLRDCITYSEPLTPMLQEVLDDFASEPEDSDREGQMQIVDNVPENDNTEENEQHSEPNNEESNSEAVTEAATNAEELSEAVEEELAQEVDDGAESAKKSKETPTVAADSEEMPTVVSDEEISSMQAENGTERVEDADDEIQGASEYHTAENTDNSVDKPQDTQNTEVAVVEKSHSEPQAQSGNLNNSNSTVDASLPNNPEALKNKNSKSAEATKNKETTENGVEISNNTDATKGPPATRKRSCSQDNTKSIENKKKKLDIKLKSKSKKAITESHVVENGENEQPKDNDEKQTNKTKKETAKKQRILNNDLDKPSTSYENNVEVIDLEKGNSRNEQAEIINPCLQNVSLFDEQFNKAKYNMSESSDTEQNKKETQMDTQETAVTKPNEVVTLKSNSDSDTVEILPTHKKKPRAGVLAAKMEREKAISNMFGFTSGGVGSKRRRQISRRRRTISHNNNHNAVVSNSSEWTSDSESDAFVSPPRGRRHRQTRKYLKPKAGKILSLEEEGGLFVMYGKKIYPLVKDGKIVKNYITYLPESDSEEGESFWKQKYVEEKKKAAELKRLLVQANEPQTRDKSPILQANPLRNASISHEQSREPASNGLGKEICIPAPEEKKEEKTFNPPEKIKIKFTRNNEEVHLEGHWPQIHPVLEQVVQIFHKEAEPPVSEKSKDIAMQPAKEPSSGVSTPIIITPVDPEVHEKVDEIEKEIFKEIEALDREEENVPNGVEPNVTKRKIGRPRKSSSTLPSPVKQQKLTNGVKINDSEENLRTRRQKAKEEVKSIDSEDNVSKRQVRTPRKVLNETLNTSDSKSIQTRRSRQNLDITNDEEEIRYMLPPKNSRLSLKTANKKTNQKPRRSAENVSKMSSSPDNFSLNSLDSTQGYQDSDPSPINKENKRKKMMDASSFVIKTRKSLRRSTRRKSHPYAYRNSYEDSSNSSVDRPVQTVARENSSAASDPYRSESYQLLMPQAKHSRNRLESIDEISPIDNQTYFLKHLESIAKDNKETSTRASNFTSPTGQMTSDVGSSSNVSLPMSPELSVVENISVSKETLNNVEDYPTINEMQNNDVQEPTVCGEYMMSDVNISVPLMQQECEFESCLTMLEVSPEPMSIVTESLIKKIDTVNINEQTPSDTLNKNLHNLLIDSSKKMTRSQSMTKKDDMMEVDVTNTSEGQKKARTRKRCSTPQKKKGTKKSAAPKVATVVEEEHVESCSHSGRKSCPALLQSYFDKNIVSEELNISKMTISDDKPKGRKKKDIIRVKIQRPKNKIAQEKRRAKSAKNTSNISVFTDSGINETESELFLPANESIDLIHNHSETCLNANECVGDSVEFVENSKSVISLGDSMQSGDNRSASRSGNNDRSSTPDLFCNNAQDVSFYNRNNSDNIDNTSDTVYHSPLGTEISANSLMTEDLSDDAPQPAVPPSKWYLLSEDDTNTNILGKGSTMLSGSTSGYGSNLKQLFPITCAIPDLSTITEMSKENDNSRKPTLEELDGLTGDDFNSHSIFDSNF
ncbi:uncharacterized protein LOC110371204 isoform X1 [Helicoverpa armigera]|uniref:uncharacterized protein LOC110371204 isoform X1 n=1 Tax=Helicoverpa armigera TaxID=29058 RepID=UPI003082BB5C